MYSIQSKGMDEQIYEEAEKCAKECAARYHEDYCIMKAVAIAKAPAFPNVEIVKL